MIRSLYGEAWIVVECSAPGGARGSTCHWTRANSLSPYSLHRAESAARATPKISSPRCLGSQIRISPLFHLTHGQLERGKSSVSLSLSVSTVSVSCGVSRHAAQQASHSN